MNLVESRWGSPENVSVKGLLGSQDAWSDVPILGFDPPNEREAQVAFVDVREVRQDVFSALRRVFRDREPFVSNLSGREEFPVPLSPGVAVLIR